jgi:hypothetical protein
MDWSPLLSDSGQIALQSEPRVVNQHPRNFYAFTYPRVLEAQSSMPALRATRGAGDKMNVPLLTFAFAVCAARGNTFSINLVPPPSMSHVLTEKRA